QCEDENESCFNERCSTDACEGVVCQSGFDCVDGTCLAACGEDGKCEPNHHCYKGYCPQESCDEPDGIRCHAGHVCHMGTCFPKCDDDSFCDEDHFCYDGRCATDSCAALVEDYDEDHFYRTLGNDRWPTLSQRSTPQRRPRPVVFSGTWDTALAEIVPAKGKGRIVLFFDESEDSYGLVLLHGAAEAAQGAAGATYSVRYTGLDEEPEVHRTVGSAATHVFIDDDFHHHQIQLQTTGGAGDGIGAVALGYLPVDREWIVNLSAAFRGDIDAWEFYSAETDTWLDLDLREELMLVNAPLHHTIILSEEVGVRECVPRRSSDGSAHEGICSRGNVTTCRYGNLECNNSIAAWSFEVCDGRDTNCDGVVDNEEATGGMLVPMVFVRQDGLFDWIQWPTVDGTTQAFDFLNYAAHGSDHGEGSADMKGVTSVDTEFDLQAGNRSLTLFHRDMDRGIITMPLTHGARVQGSFPTSSDVVFEAEFEYDQTNDFYDNSDLMFVSWYDDWMVLDGSGEPDDDSYGDRVPATMKLDELKMEWEVRQIDVDGEPGREADTALLQFVWKDPGTLRPLRFDLDANLPGSLYEWYMYRPYTMLRYLNPSKPLEVKIEWVPLEESFCMSDTASDGCRGVPYVCESGKISCPQATADNCVGCYDRDGDGYFEISDE
ncbi:MAG: hypothetical protein ACNA8W_23130, partial [Bradymonadaceae bacterium]